VSVSTADIKQLREVTGAGILDCKKVLQDTDGDIDAAIELLRKKGLASAAKKSSREANEGTVAAHVSDDGKVGVLVELNCETDFVARTDDFQNFLQQLVVQVSADSTLTDAEKLLAAEDMNNSGKTVQESLTGLIAKLGENMVLKRVARFAAADGALLDNYLHMGGRVGVLVEGTGSNGNQAQAMDILHDVALQIAALSPQYVTVDDVPAEIIAAEKEVYRAQLAEDKKTDDIKERIIEGKVKKWCSEVVLLDQQFVKDSNLTISKLLQSHDKAFTIRRFARFELGA
jgi:elongation factor Ts